MLVEWVGSVEGVGQVEWAVPVYNKTNIPITAQLKVDLKTTVNN